MAGEVRMGWERLEGFFIENSYHYETPHLL
jgi:hypothetical protein